MKSLHSMRLEPIVLAYPPSSIAEMRIFASEIQRTAMFNLPVCIIVIVMRLPNIRFKNSE